MYKLILLFFFINSIYFAFPQSRDDCPEMTTYTYDARGFKTASYFYDNIFGNIYTEYFYNDTFVVNTKSFNEGNQLTGESFFDYSTEGRLIKQENRKYLSINTDSFTKKRNMMFDPDSSLEVIENDYDNNGNLLHSRVTSSPGGKITRESHFEYKGTRLSKEICSPGDTAEKFEIIYLYDIYGRKIKKVTKYRNRKDNTEILYVYNTNGIMVKEEHYRSSVPEYYKVFKYNSSGRLTDVELYSPSSDGFNEYVSHRDHYELDKYGKLIKECHGEFTPAGR